MFGGFIAARGLPQNEQAAALPTATWTPEPLLPTPTPTVAALVNVSPIPATERPERIVPTATPVALTETVVPSVEIQQPVAGALTDEEFARVGISGKQLDAAGAWDAGLRWSHLLDWLWLRGDKLPEEITYWRTLRVAEEGWKYFESWDQLTDEAQLHPGEVWIVGNEPDVKWQDGISAELYAARYHEAYTKLKAADPTAQIAVGAVAAGTDLRLRYLDTVLATYERDYGTPMPVDIWTVHAYVLREERDSWGIDIPPGMTDDVGDLYEIEDHDSLEFFTNQIVNFRRWMVENGYRDKPLAVTEFGILLPNDYGFPEESVAQYLRDTYSLLMTLNDPELGLPADGNRLVQTMFWFILSDEQYPTGDMWSREAESLTMLGEAMRDFVGR